MKDKPQALCTAVWERSHHSNVYDEIGSLELSYSERISLIMEVCTVYTQDCIQASTLEIKELSQRSVE